MSVPAQRGIFSIAKQSAKVGSGTFTVGSETWYRYRAPRVGVSLIQSQTALPMETGGPLVPTGVTKDMAFWGGDVDLLPRCEDDFGWLLYAMMGNASSVSGVDTGTYYTHHFTYAADQADVPWLAVRRFIPGEATTDEYGEVGFDGIATNMRVNVPPAGNLACNIGFMGRKWQVEEEPSWTYTNALEDGTTIPNAGNGSLKIEGIEYPIIALTLDLNNNVSTPQQEVIVGDYWPDDFQVLSRLATFRFLYKYEDPDLCQKILTNSDTGTAFSPFPYLISTVGQNYALEAQFYAPKFVTGTVSTNYEFTARAHRIAITPGRPMELVAGGLLVQEFIGTVIEPASDKDYMDLLLVNDVSDYTW
jgi:hypothetical protein